MEVNTHSQVNNKILKIKDNISLTTNEKQDILETLIHEYDLKKPIHPDDQKNQ